MAGQADGRTDGRTEDWSDRWTDGWMGTRAHGLVGTWAHVRAHRSSAHLLFSLWRHLRIAFKIDAELLDLLCVDMCVDICVCRHVYDHVCVENLHMGVA